MLLSSRCTIHCSGPLLPDSKPGCNKMYLAEHQPASKSTNRTPVYSRAVTQRCCTCARTIQPWPAYRSTIYTHVIHKKRQLLLVHNVTLYMLQPRLRLPHFPSPRSPLLDCCYALGRLQGDEQPPLCPWFDRSQIHVQCWFVPQEEHFLVQPVLILVN